MIKLGRFNQLTILERLPRGLQLDGGSDGEILLPKQYVRDDMAIGQSIRVFIYRDSQDRLIATTQTPYAQEGEFAYLNVVDESKVGMFVNWGLPKDLLVPFAEQYGKLEKGRKVMVRIYVDDSNRLAASAKIDSFLYDLDETGRYKKGDEVNIMVAGKSDLGIKVIVDGTYWGLIYHSDVYEDLARGESRQAYIQKVRDDKKIEISLKAPGFAKVEGLAGEVLQALKDEGGFIPLSDKSAPQDIKKTFKCSKNNYKQAIGTLYKQKLIRIEKDGIYLNE